jgi:phytoene dehydrogenase-like protein
VDLALVFSFSDIIPSCKFFYLFWGGFMTKVLIVGGGVAGLSAGAHLQMNGYETEIYEMHKIPGGLCTAWKRGEYTIDGCVHWWVNTNPQDPCYPIVNGLVDMDHFPRVTYEEFCTIEDKGTVLHFYSNLERFEEELKRVCPQDGPIIEELIKGAKKIASIKIPADKAPEVMNLWDRIRMIKSMATMGAMAKKWSQPIGEYVKKIKSPVLRKLLSCFPFYPQFPIFAFLMHASLFHNKNASYPIGGAQELINRLVHRYTSLGGKLFCNSKVEKVLVENGTAKGLRLGNGISCAGDYVISAADGHHTMSQLLDRQYVDKESQELYFTEKHVPKMSQLYISLGVARTFNDSFKPVVYIPLQRPIKIGTIETTHVLVTVRNFDPTLAPKGKTVLSMFIVADNADYWVRLRNEKREAYEQEKMQIAKQMIEEVDAYFGNIKENVEMIDVATPASYIRYTNNWNGAPSGWQDFQLFVNPPKKQIKNLKNFFLCGQWLGDGGLTGSMKSGRDIAQIVCKKEGKKFKLASSS